MANTSLSMSIFIYVSPVNCYTLTLVQGRDGTTNIFVMFLHIWTLVPYYRVISDPCIFLIEVLLSLKLSYNTVCSPALVYVFLPVFT